ncbi:MAG: hypothetical protein COA33_011295 [Fluviicola sp.]|nr:hypothetical protein [Fluviicola sp.]
MVIVKKIAIRIGALAAMLFVMNFIYTSFFFEGDLQEHSPIVNAIKSVPKKTTILYLGESSNVTYAESDANKNSISEMLDGLLKNEKVTDITKPAAHSGIYKTILENVADDSRIKTVIITLNLRSFAADWVFSELEAPLQKEMMLLQNCPPLYNRFLLSFRAYGTRSERKRFEKINVWWEREFILPRNKKKMTVRRWQQQINETWEGSNIENRELAKSYVNNFAFKIDKNHPRIKDLDAIVELAKKRGWNLLFNVLPENVDAIKTLVGNDLLVLMKKNTRFLTKRYEKEGVSVVNNLAQVRESDFIDKIFPTEHYDETGRMLIAKRLAMEFMRE